MRSCLNQGPSGPPIPAGFLYFRRPYEKQISGIANGAQASALSGAAAGGAGSSAGRMHQGDRELRATAGAAVSTPPLRPPAGVDERDRPGPRATNPAVSAAGTLDDEYRHPDQSSFHFAWSDITRPIRGDLSPQTGVF